MSCSVDHLVFVWNELPCFYFYTLPKMSHYLDFTSKNKQLSQRAEFFLGKVTWGKVSRCGGPSGEKPRSIGGVLCEWWDSKRHRPGVTDTFRGKQGGHVLSSHCYRDRTATMSPGNIAWPLSKPGKKICMNVFSKECPFLCTCVIFCLAPLSLPCFIYNFHPINSSLSNWYA